MTKETSQRLNDFSMEDGQALPFPPCTMGSTLQCASNDKKVKSLRSVIFKPMRNGCRIDRMIPVAGEVYEG